MRRILTHDELKLEQTFRQKETAKNNQMLDYDHSSFDSLHELSNILLNVTTKSRTMRRELMKNNLFRVMLMKLDSEIVHGGMFTRTAEHADDQECIEEQALFDQQRLLPVTHFYFNFISTCRMCLERVR